MLRRHVIVFFSFFICNLTFAQNEYFGTLDYQNLTYKRIASIPSITWLETDNSAYDQKHHLYYVLANGNALPPWYLYTIDATTGAVLKKVICPANYDSADNILGLQFDNESGILYAIYNPHSTGGFYFSSIDPLTGNVTPISSPGISNYAYCQATFSTKNHIYFLEGVDKLGRSAFFAINAMDGHILWENNSVRMYDLAFDNFNGKLYGLENSADYQFQFDSIEVATGIQHRISLLPPTTLAQLPTTTVDEINDRYIFLGVDPTQCGTRRLYVLNLNNGDVISNQSYPFAEATGDPNAENVLFFSFDSVAGKVYALNWHVPDSIRTDIFRISASANPVCKDDPVTFTTHTPILLQGPTYQWIINSSNTGTTAPSFSSTHLSDGDTIYCIVTDTIPCDKGLTDTSNAIIVHMRNPADSQFSIVVSTNDICQGDAVLFIANSNANPDSLTWKINGSDAGHGDSLLLRSLKNGDKVSCTEADRSACMPLLASTDTITMNVMETPSIIFSPDTVFLKTGTSIQLTPQISGPAQIYSWSPPAGLNDTTIVNPIASPAHDTRYLFTAGIPEGCFSTASVFIKILYPDTVNCLNFKNVKAFPNPASNQILINFGAVWKSGTIIVYNAIGQRVSAIKVENQDHIYLYRDRFASGLYSLKFICSQAVAGILPVIFAN